MLSKDGEDRRLQPHDLREMQRLVVLDLREGHQYEPLQSRFEKLVCRLPRPLILVPRWWLEDVFEFVRNLAFQHTDNRHLTPNHSRNHGNANAVLHDLLCFPDVLLLLQEKVILPKSTYKSSTIYIIHAAVPSDAVPLCYPMLDRVGPGFSSGSCDSESFADDRDSYLLSEGGDSDCKGIKMILNY